MYLASAAVIAVAVVGMAAPAAADDRVPVSTTITSSRGGLGKPAALAVIDGNAGVGACFRAIQPEKVKATLTVTPAGAVSSVKLRGGRKLTRSCLTRALQALAFPAGAKKSTIRVTLTLDASDLSALAFADALTADDGSVTEGDMSRVRPGADLSAQVRGSNGSSGSGTGSGSGSAAPSGPLGRITLAGKQASGGHSVATVVNNVLSAYMPGLKRCYKDALATQPSLTGSLVLAFDIALDGRVGTASATGIVELATCIRAQMTAWRFPAADAATSVELRLKLVPD